MSVYFSGYEAFYQTRDITIMDRRTFREIENLSDAGNIYPTTRNFVFPTQKVLPSRDLCLCAPIRERSEMHCAYLFFVYNKIKKNFLPAMSLW